MNESDLPQEEMVTLLDYLLPLLRWRWLIFLGCVLCAVLGAAFALGKEPYFKASAYFMPRGALGEADGLRNLAGATGKDWKSLRSESDAVKYFNVAMKVRPLLENLLKRTFETADGPLPLMDIDAPAGDTGTDRLAERVAALSKAIDVETVGGKLLTVSYTASDPRLAADVANAVLDEFQKLPRLAQQATADMQLIEARLSDVRASLEQQEAQIVQAKSKSIDSTQPDTLRRLNAMEREVRVLEKLYGDLNAEYAKAEIRRVQGQTDNTQEIEVIDQARPPVTRAGPNRAKIVLVFIFVGGVLTSMTAFTIEYFRGLATQFGQHPFWAFFKKARWDIVFMAVTVGLAVAALMLYRIVHAK